MRSSANQAPQEAVEQEMELALQRPIAPTLPRRPQTETMPRVDGDAISDGELLTRIGAGERDAFEELHSRYARAVLGLALRRLGDRGRAEDATQEVFAAVWRSARSYDPRRGAGSSWLFAVARNAIVDGFRRRPEPVAEPPDLPSAEAGPPERAEAGWVAWRVHRALESLPEHERPVIELAYWGGLSQREISDFLQIPLGTVKTRTRSALARLADALEGELQ